MPLREREGWRKLLPVEILHTPTPRIHISLHINHGASTQNPEPTLMVKMMIKYPWRRREAFHIFLDFENAEVITSLSVFQRQKKQFEALLVVHPSLQKCIGTPFSGKGGCRTKNKEAIHPANPLAANDDKIMALKRITRSFHVTGLNGTRMDLQVFRMENKTRTSL
ncbi:hypothetical protein CEXT_580151 [Caerostris extrusa]|uniref:Uncharacterized protein n=1 Tax=Caerostris extrusa TaxID=172846 RepID=A0AAV4RA74_CAEEX|nr:hypothetical protein CEXT_580151 [Caerostris extrusa]